MFQLAIYSHRLLYVLCLCNWKMIIYQSFIHNDNRFITGLSALNVLILTLCCTILVCTNSMYQETAPTIEHFPLAQLSVWTFHACLFLLSMSTSIFCMLFPSDVKVAKFNSMFEHSGTLHFSTVWLIPLWGTEPVAFGVELLSVENLEQIAFLEDNDQHKCTCLNTKFNKMT